MSLPASVPLAKSSDSLLSFPELLSLLLIIFYSLLLCLIPTAFHFSLPWPFLSSLSLNLLLPETPPSLPVPISVSDKAPVEDIHCHSTGSMVVHSKAKHGY